MHGQDFFSVAGKVTCKSWHEVEETAATDCANELKIVQFQYFKEEEINKEIQAFH